MEIGQDCMKLAREQTGIESQGILDCFRQDSIFSKYKTGVADSKAPFKLFETSNCSTSDDQGLDDQSSDDKKFRGPYRKYTIQEKMKAVQRIISGQDVKVISKQFGIPRRNLLRWKKNGCQRKQGGGRPTDAQMERSIYQKIVSKELQTQKQIRRYAIELSKTSSFKASKGWFVKFCNRFEITIKPINQQMEKQCQIKTDSNESMDQQVQI